MSVAGGLDAGGTGVGGFNPASHPIHDLLSGISNSLPPPSSAAPPSPETNPYFVASHLIKATLTPEQISGAKVQYQIISGLLGLTSLVGVGTLLASWWSGRKADDQNLIEERVKKAREEAIAKADSEGRGRADAQRIGDAAVETERQRARKRKWWLFKRVKGVRGYYLVPNPSTVFIFPVLGFTICCQIAVRKTIKVMDGGDFKFLMVYFVLAVCCLWTAGWVQGTALLHSVSRFLVPPAASASPALWLASSSTSPFSLHRLHPWLLNIILLATPALVTISVIVPTAISAAWLNPALDAVFSVSKELQDLGVQFMAIATQIASSSVPSGDPTTSKPNATEWMIVPGSEEKVESFDERFASLPNQTVTLRSFRAAFAFLIIWDAVFFVFYLRFAYAVVRIIFGQLSLLTKTVAAFNKEDRPRIFPGSPPPLSPPLAAHSSIATKADTSTASRSSTGKTTKNGLTSPSHLPATVEGEEDDASRTQTTIQSRRVRDTLDDWNIRERQAHIAKARVSRLKGALFSILGLAICMVLIAAVDAALVAWAVSRPAVDLFKHLLIVAFWTWTITALFSVSWVASQIITDHRPALPQKSIIPSPPDPFREYYYGEENEEDESAVYNRIGIGGIAILGTNTGLKTAGPNKETGTPAIPASLTKPQGTWRYDSDASYSSNKWVLDTLPERFDGSPPSLVPSTLTTPSFDSKPGFIRNGLVGISAATFRADDDSSKGSSQRPSNGGDGGSNRKSRILNLGSKRRGKGESIELKDSDRSSSGGTGPSSGTEGERDREFLAEFVPSKHFKQALKERQDFQRKDNEFEEES